MHLFATALTNVAAKTARNDVIALSEATRKSLRNLYGLDCMPCAEPRKQTRPANYSLLTVNRKSIRL